MDSYVLDLQEIDQTQVAVAGGKGAHLGALTRVEGVRVPAGFCVTTEAFRRTLEEAPSVADRLWIGCRAWIRRIEGRFVRSAPRSAERSKEPPCPATLRRPSPARSLVRAQRPPTPVRSSATAEDLPTASFAGQQDTYLNVIGSTEVLRHVSRCWASLFTERAVTYRLRNGVDHRQVQMGVVVQQMVVPQAADVLFTADPVTSNRKVLSVEATFGLGEALVAGVVNADVYKVRDGEIVDKAIASKQRAILASPAADDAATASGPFLIVAAPAILLLAIALTLVPTQLAAANSSLTRFGATSSGRAPVRCSEQPELTSIGRARVRQHAAVTQPSTALPSRRIRAPGRAAGLSVMRRAIRTANAHPQGTNIRRSVAVAPSSVSEWRVRPEISRARRRRSRPVRSSHPGR
jgi:Pyruvate phosphate dikinase, AMP/ATP-binding domain